MNILQLIIYCLLFSVKAWPSDLWDNLLHQNEVAAEGWYLSAEKTSASEKETFLKLLTEPEGLESICEFPARFFYFTEILKLKSLHNLDKCHDLQSFYSKFDKLLISLVLTSEYYNSPSSAFGHIMLVMHNLPEIEMDAFAVHFSAITTKTGFLAYSINGLTGNFYGYFFKDPYFLKFNEYSNIEQRYLYVHPMNFKEHEKKLFLYHLYELKKARFKYYFLAKNCGYQIDKLLQISFQKTFKSEKIYLTPSEVLKRHKEKVQNIMVIPPMMERAKNAISKLSSIQKDALAEIIDDETGELPLSNELDDKLKKALVLYHQYQFRKKRNVLPRYNDVMKLNVSNFNEPIKETKIASPLNDPSPRRLSLKSSYNNFLKKTSFDLGFRPLLVDLSDFQNTRLNETNFNLLYTELQFQQNKARLKRLDIINLKLIYETERFFRDPSWIFNLSINRDNFAGLKSFSQQVGIGHSFSFLFLWSYFIGPQMELTEFKDFKFAMASELNSIYYFGHDLKLLYEGKLKYYRHKKFYNHDLSLIKKTSLLNVSLGFNYNEHLSQFLRLDYYF